MFLGFFMRVCIHQKDHNLTDIKKFPPREKDPKFISFPMNLIILNKINTLFHLLPQ